MKVAIRADAGLGIGTGHVMRCMALAGTMAKRGASVLFICRELAGHLCDQIEQSGFAVAALPAAQHSGVSHLHQWKQDAEESLEALRRRAFEADLLVVDQYSLDARWERALRPRARQILVIDDLADRVHDCDLLLDPNLHDSPETRYRRLVNAKARVFVGPRYALLRPEFDCVTAKERDQGVRNILAFFGGADPSNEALKIVHALRELGALAPQTRIVLGPINPWVREIREAAATVARLELTESTNQMALLMADADLSLGTCGGAAWERCLLGLPAIVVVSAENQRDDARILHSLGAVRNLGQAGEINAQSWAAAISDMLRDPRTLAAMSRSARAVMSGRDEAMRDFESALGV